MHRQTVSGLVLMLLFTSMLSSAFIIQPVKAESESIYIRADGAVDPPTAPILNVGNVHYTLVADIRNSIVIERDNIVVNGAGHLIQGPGSTGYGIDLSGRTNVKVRNTRIENFGLGINLYYSSYNSLSGNNITANTIHGIVFTWSSYNDLSGNNITANRMNGIQLHHSSNNSLNGNNIANNNHGISADYSSDNSVSGNNITANRVVGIKLTLSSCNDLSGNNITAQNYAGGYGINLYWSSDYNNVTGNNIANNGIGIQIGSSDYNSVAGNNIANNGIGTLLGSSNYNSASANNFVNNAMQVRIYPGSLNLWDDGFPSGGNYWSDYEERYPVAEELDDSGIWNTPYVIDENNQDNYPLMNPWIPQPVGKFEEDDYVETTAVPNLKVRSSPGIPVDDSNVITKLPLGSLLQIVKHDDNGKRVDGHHWWYVKFGVAKGWVEEECLEKYDFCVTETLEGVELTQYNVCLEEEIEEMAKSFPQRFGAGESVAITGYKGNAGVFNRAFLYSFYGVCGQGSGKARASDDRIVKFRRGGGGWLNRDGESTEYKDGAWTSPPFWIADQESVSFAILPPRLYTTGKYEWDIYPWYSIATDPRIISAGSIVFIEELARKTLLNGETLNGYFMAADIGSAVEEAHIDIFVGLGEEALEDWGNLWEGRAEVFADVEIYSNIPFKRAKLGCPGELRVYDSQDRVSGIVNGVIKEEIPSSGYDSVDRSVTIVTPTDSYQYTMAGTGEGPYDLTVISATEQEAIVFVASAIPTSDKAIHQYTIDWSALSLGEEGVTVQIDCDGDGVFEHSFASDGELTGSEFVYAELRYLKEYVMNLPGEVFMTDDPDEFVEFQKEMLDKINETRDKLGEDKYSEAVVKLQDMKEAVIVEMKLQSDTKSDLCIIIDHVIASIEALLE